ncbi:MAG: hypothetical protein DRO05_01835 [Thermoproteota archaeon]|nr:MAG: hypothetical protein DRO05_01835 [Candidatus Korarchaeota archaeon]
MEARYLELLKKLVSLNTDATRMLNYEEASSLIFNELEKLGLDTKIVGEKVPNVVARLDVGADKDLAIVSHYDVVPAEGPWIINGNEVDPFQPLELEGKLYGRGSADDKSAIVASIWAVAEVKDKELRYNPLLIITGGEEVGGIGIREVVSAGITGDLVLVADADIEYIGIGASGVVHGWITVRGKEGHAGYPHLARNPVNDLICLCSELMRFAERRALKFSKLDSPPNSPISKIWGRFTFTMLQAGSKHNVIPSTARAGFDMRIVPGEDPKNAIMELKSEFEAIREKLNLNAELEILEPINEGWMTDPQHPFVQEALEVYERVFGYRRICGELGGNDGYIFSKKGKPTIALGAMRKENNIHGRNEFVYLQDVIRLKEFMKGLLVGART